MGESEPMRTYDGLVCTSMSGDQAAQMHGITLLCRPNILVVRCSHLPQNEDICLICSADWRYTSHESAVLILIAHANMCVFGYAGRPFDAARVQHAELYSRFGGLLCCCVHN